MKKAKKMNKVIKVSFTLINLVFSLVFIVPIMMVVFVGYYFHLMMKRIVDNINEQ